MIDFLDALRKALEQHEEIGPDLVPESLDPSILADRIAYTPTGVIYYFLGEEIGRGPLPKRFKQ